MNQSHIMLFPNILTLDEVANYLRLSKEVIEKLANSGKIPGRRIEDSWRFLRTAIDDWVRGSDSQANLLTEEETLIVQTRLGQQLVILPLKEFKSWQETLYLLSNPVNAARLNQSIAEAQQGKTTERGLIEV